MEAAAYEFAERGFHATTTRDIAARAGLSPAGVYVHFPSKEHLLFDLSERGHRAARDMLVAASAAATSPTDALAAIVRTFTQWHAEHHRLGRIAQYEFAHLAPEHRDVVLGLRKEIDAVVQSVLRAGVTAGEFHLTDIPETALALNSLCIDVARWYEPGIRRTPAQIAETNAELGLRLAGVREAAAPEDTATR